MDTATCRSQQDDHSLHADGYCNLQTSAKKPVEAKRHCTVLMCIVPYSMFEGNGRVMDPVASLRLIEMWETLALQYYMQYTTHVHCNKQRERRGRQVDNSAHVGQGRGWALGSRVQ